MREIAERLGLTLRAVQKTVKELERLGYLRRRRQGRGNRYVLLLSNRALPPPLSHRTTRDLIDLLAPRTSSE